MQLRLLISIGAASLDVIEKLYGSVSNHFHAWHFSASVLVAHLKVLFLFGGTTTGSSNSLNFHPVLSWVAQWHQSVEAESLSQRISNYWLLIYKTPQYRYIQSIPGHNMTSLKRLQINFNFSILKWSRRDFMVLIFIKSSSVPYHITLLVCISW